MGIDWSIRDIGDIRKSRGFGECIDTADTHPQKPVEYVYKEEEMAGWAEQYEFTVYMDCTGLTAENPRFDEIRKKYIALRKTLACEQAKLIERHRLAVAEDRKTWLTVEQAIAILSNYPKDAYLTVRVDGYDYTEPIRKISDGEILYDENYNEVAHVVLKYE